MQVTINQEKIDKINRLHDILKSEGFSDVVQKHNAKRSSDCYTYITKELFNGLTIIIFTSHGNNAELKVELSVRGINPTSKRVLANITHKANQLVQEQQLSGFEALIVDYIQPKSERYRQSYEINKVVFQSPAGAVEPVGTTQPYSGYCMQLAKYNKGCQEREVPHVVAQLTRLLEFMR